MPAVEIDAAIEILNEALEADPEVMQKIFAFHITSSTKLRNHPSIQVMNDGTISALGIINGFFGVRPEDSYGYISGVWEEGRLVRFERT
jgi:hypothetical protein